MPVCAVLTCRARTRDPYARDQTKYHPFPKDAEIRRKWIDMTGRDSKWTPSGVNGFVCSKHFREADYTVKRSGQRYLKTGAIPCEYVVYKCLYPDAVPVQVKQEQVEEDEEQEVEEHEQEADENIDFNSNQNSDNNDGNTNQNEECENQSDGQSSSESEESSEDENESGESDEADAEVDTASESNSTSSSVDANTMEFNENEYSDSDSDLSSEDDYDDNNPIANVVQDSDMTEDDTDGYSDSDDDTIIRDELVSPPIMVNEDDYNEAAANMNVEPQRDINFYFRANVNLDFNSELNLDFSPYADFKAFQMINSADNPIVDSTTFDYDMNDNAIGWKNRQCKPCFCHEQLEIIKQLMSKPRLFHRKIVTPAIANDARNIQMRLETGEMNEIDKADAIIDLQNKRILKLTVKHRRYRKILKKIYDVLLNVETSFSMKISFQMKV